ncbi:hypothetical protein HanIR_Chr17g0857221 [Helianthus annuus]|nr:hypothetical protein HanIR_Chr17g0857221 [Helianthus annuus]
MFELLLKKEKVKKKKHYHPTRRNQISFQRGRSKSYQTQIDYRKQNLNLLIAISNLLREV